MKIKIKNCQRKITINRKRIDSLAKQVLKIKGIKDAELSILFVGRGRSQTLNKRFRKIDRPADVLAFCMQEGKDFRLHPELLGDLVICPQIAKSSAKTYNTTTEYEICLYLIHGILHLLGCNDITLKSRAKMKKEQTRILNMVMPR